MYSNTKTFLIVELAEYPFGPCQGLTCGQYISCFCVAGNPNKNVTNVPMGTTINTKFLKCTIINGEWIEYELEYYFQLIPGDADISYQIFARLNESSDYVVVGRMNFTETQPPPCSDSPQCCDDLPFCENFVVPNVVYVPKDAGYLAPLTDAFNDTLLPCAHGNHSCSIDGGMTAFDTAPFHLVEGYDWNLQPCTNPLNDKVRFNYSMTHNGGSIYYIPLVYGSEYCPNDCNPPKIWIEDEDDLVQKLTPENVCQIEHDICNHYGIYPIPTDHMLREVSEIHENNHLLEFETKMNIKNYNFLDQRMRKVETDCNIYRIDPEGAERKAAVDFTNIFMQLFDVVKKEYLYYTDEVAVQSYPNILASVVRYAKIADKWRRDYSVECDGPVCDNLSIFLDK